MGGASEPLEFPFKDGSESHPTEASIIQCDPGSGGIVGEPSWERMRSLREVSICTSTNKHQTSLKHTDTKIKHRKLIQLRN